MNNFNVFSSFNSNKEFYLDLSNQQPLLLARKVLKLMLHMKYQLHKNNFNIDISFQFCVQKDPKKQKAPEENIVKHKLDEDEIRRKAAEEARNRAIEEARKSMLEKTRNAFLRIP